MPERIVWAERAGGHESGWYGTVGYMQLFTVTRSPVPGEGWKLSSRLPYNPSPPRAIGAEGDVKAYAERVLNHFVRFLGAVWPDKAEES